MFFSSLPPYNEKQSASLAPKFELLLSTKEKFGHQKNIKAKGLNQIIGGSREARRRPPPPTGPDSFVLTCKLFET